ncbi:rust resistance kinase Lr10-like [Dioscorea cayenensis subsp. rotundata]|uniref:Rust resistance kinase Lr10-like n=1 Tax=Dioscorea cayennensis subsp. rotundata TaxID=55577 RepID=A0AB40AY22_DIOCR|nr:rust resistance kinase Lr10-like [Dioscorea cayenensis subsp. rotundata]
MVILNVPSPAVVPSVKHFTIFFLISFFFFSSSTLVSVAAGDHCAPSSCGNLTNIRYPFRLKDDPSNCGDPNYELTCDHLNHTILTLSSHSYYITDIKYLSDKSFMIHVKYVGMEKYNNFNNGSCSHIPLPASPLTLSDQMRSNKYYDVFGWVTYVNCSKEVKDNVSKYYYRPVPCLSNNNSFIYHIDPDYYRLYEVHNLNYGVYEVRNLMPSCRFLAMFPDNSYIDWYSIDQQPTDIFKFLDQGFTLRSFSKSAYSPGLRHCLNESLRENYQYITYDKHSIKRWIEVIALGIESHFLGCIDVYDHNRKHYYRVISIIYIVVILLQIVKALVVFAVLGRCVFAPLTVYAFLSYKLYQIMSYVDNVEKFLRNQQTLVPTRYSYTDIITMTNNFKEKLGQGGFGSVFKGRLPWDRLVAIKMLTNSKYNAGEDFINEVSTIGRIHHINVVKLIGFCSDGTQRALVYEYMPNGSLDKFIFSSSNVPNHKFSLDKLIDIALGVARGLDYLHKGCNMQILHFDIKPHNILLDHNFNPKVSDFGLAKLYPKNNSLVSLSVARGTIGYIAPELISRSFGVISHKCDVYSFGMLLLEMAGGRRNSDPKAENTSQVYYPSWIYDKLIEDTIESNVVEMDTTIEINEREKKLSMIGLWCIQIRPSDRPSMCKVIEMLESDMSSLQMPPKPFFSEPT